MSVGSNHKLNVNIDNLDNHNKYFNTLLKATSTNVSPSSGLKSLKGKRTVNDIKDILDGIVPQSKKDLTKSVNSDTDGSSSTPGFFSKMFGKKKKSDPALHNLTLDKLKQTVGKPSYWEQNIFSALPYWYSSPSSDVYYRQDTGNVKSSEMQLFGDPFAKVIADMIKPIFSQRYKTSSKWMRDDMPDFNSDPTFIEKITITNPNAKVHMIGDIHGSLHSLHYVLKKLSSTNAFKPDSYELDTDHYLIFLGDIVDYSYFSLECLALVFLLYILNPTKVTIINGNHEDAPTYGRYNFNQEMQSQIPITAGIYTKLLYYLPAAVYLQYNGKTYHLSHGAYDHIYCDLGSSVEDPLTKLLKDNSKQFDKFNSSVESNYKWGDFNEMCQSKSLNPFVDPSTGRAQFCKRHITQYLKKYNIECIISGHQDTVPLGLLTHGETSPVKTFSKQEFRLDAQVTEGGYNLYVPVNLSIPALLPLNPKTDFMALVTSNAAQSKGTEFTCYLTLESRGLEGGGSKGNKSKRDYEYLYRKYKVKYLNEKLKNTK